MKADQRGFLVLETILWTAFLGMAVTSIASAYLHEYGLYRKALVEIHRPLEGRKSLMDIDLPDPLDDFFKGAESVCEAFDLS
ncbi:MAG: hypothetical protein AAB425_04920 [Bdellovibrionota bacterium]